MLNRVLCLIQADQALFSEVFSAAFSEVSPASASELSSSASSFELSSESSSSESFESAEVLSESLIVDLSKVKEQPVSPAVAVDAACAGNPGKMEYQGVFVDFGTQPATTVQLFKSPVFENGTNNIGEFLAIVHALAWMKQKHVAYPIYSDSYNAQLWIKQKKCKTKLQPNDKNAYLFELIARAEKWLNENAIEVPVMKWKTEIWGEIPADFGRK